MQQAKQSLRGERVSLRDMTSLLSLAAPVVASQAGGMMVSVADTYMVGRLGETELGAVAFSSNLTVPVMFFGIGVATAVTPLIGRRYGRGSRTDIGRTVHHAWRMNWALTIFMVGVLTLLWALMPFMGQPEDVVDVAHVYLPLVIASMVGQQMYVAAKTIVEGLQDTRTPMVVTLSVNALNIVGNYVLIFGLGPIPAIGVYGAAVSTLVARLVAWVWMETAMRRKLRSLHIESAPSGRRGIGWRLFLIGLPVGTQSVIECIGFTLGGIMMGWIGTETLAAHQVVNLFTSLTFLMAVGIGTAVTVKVSISCGQQEYGAARRYTLAGLFVVGLSMACSAVLLISLRDVLPSLFLASAKSLETASWLMIAGACFQLFDGLQATSIGALRGYGDLRYPAVVAGVAYACTCVPVGYLMAFVVGLEGPGVWCGFIAGLGTACVLLLRRLRSKVFNR